MCNPDDMIDTPQAVVADDEPIDIDSYTDDQLRDFCKLNAIPIEDGYTRADMMDAIESAAIPATDVQGE